MERLWLSSRKDGCQHVWHRTTLPSSKSIDAWSTSHLKYLIALNTRFTVFSCCCKCIKIQYDLVSPSSPLVHDKSNAWEQLERFLNLFQISNGVVSSFCSELKIVICLLWKLSTDNDFLSRVASGEWWQVATELSRSQADTVASWPIYVRTCFSDFTARYVCTVYI